jgi:3-deoxy-D-arabino-heptulosonate 7-phosphate (DAHP) synthase
MTRAPEQPTTQELHANYPLSVEAELAIASMRSTVSEAINNYRTHTLGVVGYCSRPSQDQAEVIMRESGLVAEIQDPASGLVTLHRGPMWKPRSSADSWHGQETTDPEGVYMTMRDEAELHANVAVEVGHDYHLSRYGHLLSFIWTGGRNVDDGELIKAAALEDPTIPLGIKNDVDGTIDTALEQVAMARELRGPNDAPVVLIYRGGYTVDTPGAWQEAIIDVHEQTDGQALIDIAHGSEMAHDPEGNFEKSPEGQVGAFHSLDRVARLGRTFAGTMMEASQLKSDVDPHMSLTVALAAVQRQHLLKRVNSSENPEYQVPLGTLFTFSRLAL